MSTMIDAAQAAVGIGIFALQTDAWKKYRSKKPEREKKKFEREQREWLGPCPSPAFWRVYGEADEDGLRDFEVAGLVKATKVLDSTRGKVSECFDRHFILFSHPGPELKHPPEFSITPFGGAQAEYSVYLQNAPDNFQHRLFHMSSADDEKSQEAWEIVKKAEKTGQIVYLTGRIHTQDDKQPYLMGDTPPTRPLPCFRNFTRDPRQCCLIESVRADFLSI